MIFLDLDALLHVARRTLGAEPEVRDYGLLESALARPQASAFGQDAYPTIHEKSAALLHSLARLDDWLATVDLSASVGRIVAERRADAVRALRCQQAAAASGSA